LIRSLLFYSLLPVLVWAAPDPAPPQIITVPTRGPSQPFPHTWETVMGSERAITSLRESYRHDLRQTQAQTGLRYVRFHGIFNDDVGIYTVNEEGVEGFNFTYVDQIYDGLIENGIKPFVELSFMPSAIASRLQYHPFWYKPIIAPPKTWEHWDRLITEFARHLIERYGEKEVASWYFDVWNEPNLDFWGGEPKDTTYFKLYEVTARALKKVNPHLRVGGPVSAYVAWIERFLNFCDQQKVPVDFVSTHVYGDDNAQWIFDSPDPVSRADLIPRALARARAQIKRSAFPDLPLYVTEMNATFRRKIEITDSAFMGPWLAQTVARCDGVADILAFWTFSDVFEEMGVAPAPFYGGFGLFAPGSIPKPSFHAFTLLHRLGLERIPHEDPSILVTRRPDQSLAIMIWNYQEPKQTGPDKKVELHLPDLLPGSGPVKLWRVDMEHGSALAVWEKQKRPAFPSRPQQEELRQAAVLPDPIDLPVERHGTTTILRLTVPPHGLQLIEIPVPRPPGLLDWWPW
jgi:xylan 1,4-beta-xylosidase